MVFVGVACAIASDCNFCRGKKSSVIGNGWRNSSNIGTVLERHPIVDLKVSVLSSNVANIVVLSERPWVSGSHICIDEVGWAHLHLN